MREYRLSFERLGAFCSVYLGLAHVRARTPNVAQLYPNLTHYC